MMMAADENLEEKERERERNENENEPKRIKSSSGSPLTWIRSGIAGLLSCPNAIDSAGESAAPVAWALRFTLSWAEPYILVIS